MKWMRQTFLENCYYACDKYGEQWFILTRRLLSALETDTT